MSTNYIAPIWRMPENTNKDKLSNYSIEFDGSTYISIEDNILSGLSNFSISVWYNTNTLTGDRAVLGAWSSGVTQMLLYWDDPDGWRFLMSNGTVSTDVIWGTATSINTWNHIVVTFDGTTLSFHHNNGTPVTDGGTGPVNTSSSAWRIGVDTSSTRYWDGELSQFCLFDYALSTDQITYLYNLNNPMAITGAEPIQYLPLGDNSNPNAPGSFPNISTGTDSVFDFNGSNETIRITDTGKAPTALQSIGNENSYTVAGWINTTSTSTGGGSWFSNDTFIDFRQQQGYNDRLDESLGNKHKGDHQQSMKDRRDESKAMSKKEYGHAYGGDHSMKYEKHYPKSVKGHLGKLIKK